MPIRKRDVSPRFVATKWDTVEDKEKFFAQFKKLVENGFRPSDFPQWFYTRLSMIFGHIAHYNQGGFYAEQFSNPNLQRQFLRSTLRWPCHGDPTFVYSDVELAIQKWLLSRTDIINRVEKAVIDAIEERDRAEFARLKAKFDG